MEAYLKVHQGEPAFYGQSRGLIAVWGREAEQFLNGMVTNDIRKANERTALKAAFANAKGRLLAIVRIKRVNERFLFETDEQTHEKILNHLLKFTLAGDFFVEDLSRKHRFFRGFNLTAGDFQTFGKLISFESAFGEDFFVENNDQEDFLRKIDEIGAKQLSSDEFETLRIEAGEPKYGVDMDETTVVPELGIEGLISYNKGCYIGQEIIARIHFRGHVAKELKGLIFDEKMISLESLELLSLDGKSAGHITSLTFSPYLDAAIALAYVRYDYLAEGTRLKVQDRNVTVKSLPFVNFSRKRAKANES
ncbi:MAG: hypothetical protein N2Z23_03500 [Pyrinomonadaceae bacterium]|nr:hypothetical protein [Pyrinomonadaceae bacterium]MCX7639493.1 hypothetical protein [Pyrinomonadaceae bacterium]MDW8304456.1 glycine cleavage T C-terminal barrel domain-containing protein [Acidobacteriota bacterium]